MTQHIAWVEVIPQDKAEGTLAEAYDTVKGKDGKVENLYLAMSQTPAAIQPADAHYLALLHNPDNPLEPWLAELVSTYAAILCGCRYAVVNHGANFRMHLGDEPRADAILQALEAGEEPANEDSRMLAALRYARKLSLKPDQMNAEDLDPLRAAGFCDKGISYLIQITAAFAYWARMINGLGTQLGETVGLANTPAPEPE
ncbi:peroxidase-related enzyme [Leisingera sp. ANG-Vp]|uniref:peroxidase-related enzyme n=1 Tax=Leisingera sp. ANG-Vp TaxID=1577896 RepID=UPI00068EEC56|nr:peroxidase-related enzyme [Leisingera sp. ANG-Vp]